MTTVSFQLPANVEQQLRRELGDLNVVAKEAALVELYRQGQLSHGKLAESLGLSRYETDAVLKRHNVTEDLVDSRGTRRAGQRPAQVARPMIVVSDTTPLNYLILIGQQDVLPVLFSRVVAPPAVLAECRMPERRGSRREMGGSAASLAGSCCANHDRHRSIPGGWRGRSHCTGQELKADQIRSTSAVHPRSPGVLVR